MSIYRAATSALVSPFQQENYFTTLESSKRLKFLPAAEWRAGKCFLFNTWDIFYTFIFKRLSILRLIASVFRIFTNEVLGYDVTLVIQPENMTVMNPNSQFMQLSSCRNALWVKFVKESQTVKFLFLVAMITIPTHWRTKLLPQCWPLTCGYLLYTMWILGDCWTGGSWVRLSGRKEVIIQL